MIVALGKSSLDTGLEMGKFFVAPPADQRSMRPCCAQHVEILPGRSESSVDLRAAPAICGQQRA
eukprot:8197490-Pyramimonas_sp.AAC.1